MKKAVFTKINTEEHRFILKTLKSNKYIKEVFKLEEVKKLGIRFRRHPKSKKYTNEDFGWQSWCVGIIDVALREKSIFPLDPDERLYWLLHEIGHIINEHSAGKFACNRRFESCLLEELKADLYVVKTLKKLKKKFERGFWSERFGDTRKQCKGCLKTINKRKCPENIIEKNEKYLDILDRASKIESRRIIFSKKKKKVILVIKRRTN